MRTRSNAPEIGLTGTLGARLAICLTLLIGAIPLLAEPKPHPSLVNAATAKCETCHREVTAQPNRHEAIDSCDNCHQFGGEKGRTTVELSEAQPGLCVNCHDAQARTSKGEVAAPHAPVTDSCTSCHSPHSSANRRLLIEPVPTGCLGCHDGAELDTKHKVSVSRVNCARCHNPHGSEFPKALLTDKQHPPFAEGSCQSCHRRGLKTRSANGPIPDTSKTCFACHDAATTKGMFTHSAVTRGQCAGCHEPHLSPEKKLLRASGRKLCAACHAPIEAKLALASAHEPAKDDCATCHAAHSSNNPKQLSDVSPALCLNCHDSSDAPLVKKHLGAKMEKLDCTSCHDPHGSVQKPLLISKSLHPPFVDKSCDSCHDGSSSKLVENGSRTLCFACHSDIEEQVTKAKIPHAALEAVECTECHSPHASKQRKLVKLPAGGECLSCHDDKAAGAGEVLHGAIVTLGCESCHAPHGGEREKLLRDDVDQLCLSCHDKGRWATSADGKSMTLAGRFELSAAEGAEVRTLKMIGSDPEHPITGHRALGVPTEKELAGTKTKFRGTLSCLTCHDPHKGKSRQLFKAGKTNAMEVCLDCHEK
jgi:predicted CXXCH cytochrome family protein